MENCALKARAAIYLCEVSDTGRYCYNFIRQASDTINQNRNRFDIATSFVVRYRNKCHQHMAKYAHSDFRARILNNAHFQPKACSTARIVTYYHIHT